MSVVHPVYISPVNTYQFLIGKDLLDRFEPLLDFKHLQIWAQVREPLPLQPHKSIEPECQATGIVEIPSARHEDEIPTAVQGSSSLLCTFRTTPDSDNYCPQVKTPLQLQDVTATDIILALWADNSAISLSLFNAILEQTPDLPYTCKRTRFPLNPEPTSLTSAKGICALNLTWNHRHLTHYFLILEDPAHDVYIGADILIRLKAHVDMFNETIPEVCTLINEQETVVPAYTKGVAVRLNLRQGQTLNHTLAFFQPSPECVELGLTLEATPLTEVSSRVVYILFNNCTAADISIPKAYRLGWLVSNDFHDFELILPVIGPIPPALIPEGHTDNTLFTAPFQFIAITSVMHPEAPPTFVKQYKIPIASHEPVREIIESMLEKNVIRACNSTYSAPLWPVLKPNGKWRPTIDYRKLNQQVPLSRWPMTQLEQEIPQIRGATIFSTLDVASGFWTIPVHPDDQHKLAFTFGNRQYTFNRCPFGYANSPAEFNIFLNKACPDARMRGNLIYVDDVLMKSTTVADHLKEIDYVLNQLSAAGAKIALHKGQWCKSKVNYVGLLIGPHGIEPQSNRIHAIQNIKPPTNVSELRSFLGVCNYSRQFIENYSDIARPLTTLLKKNCPFVWSDAQEHAMVELKRHLCTAPCLAYPDPQKEFHLEAGFSNQCLSAGLYQQHDQDKKVVAYASKTLLPPECKFSDCEKALLCTVWAIQRFSNYIGAQKVIIETCHQPVMFLNSQRIRDGVVTNSRIATWLMALQGRNVEARYAQNHKSALGNGLAACQNCSDNSPAATLNTPEPQEPPLTCHRYFDKNACESMPTAYVDGCSYNSEGILKAGAGVLWVNDHPCPPQHFKLGPKSSQYAEIAAILIALQIAASNNIKEILICTDSNYARLSFYWKKVKGHSKLPGQDKDFNDHTDALAKAGALHGTPWNSPKPSPTPDVAVLTRSKKPAPATAPASQMLSLTPQISNNDLAEMQASDTAIKTMILHLKDPSPNPIAPSDTTDNSDLRHLHNSRHMLRVRDDILWFVTDDTTSPKLVVPRCQRGEMINHAHNAPYAGHHGTRATYETLRQVAYWPGMQQDVAEYVRECLVCCQFHPTNLTHRAPLQRRGITFPWSDLQIDWVGPLPRSSRGNKYFLTVVCQFTKWVECLPAPNDTAQTTAYLLMNHIFSRFGLPLKVNSDRGTHFTAEIMQKIWRILGVQAKLHISHHPISSGQVERSNRTVVAMLRKYVSANQKDWDVKLPLVLMAIRATPQESTRVAPFELMTGRPMTLPLHLLYQPGDNNLVTAYTTSQYLDELHRHLKTTFAFAQQHLKTSAEGQKAFYDKKASHQELSVGDKVLYYSFALPPKQLSKKFLPHWTGPHEIVNKLSPVAYQIQLKRGPREPVLKWVHRNQIRRYVARSRDRQEEANTN
ncbi:hypothetical protein PO909_000227 [Leuciscus waleckii]